MSNTVYYSQEDIRWKNVMYSIRNDKTQTIGTSGCGPTCAAMVISTFTGKPVLPTDTATWSIKNGHRTLNDGTAWAFYVAIAKAYGLSCVQTGKLDDVKKALAVGHLVVASIGAGHFTSGGHYVLLTGITGEWITVHDPNHDNTKYGKDGKIREGIKNDGVVEAYQSIFSAEAKQYWIYEKPSQAETKKEDADIMELSESDWKLVENSIKSALEKGLISDKSWLELAQKRTMTNSKANALSLALAVRAAKS